MEIASPPTESPPRHSNEGSMAESVSPQGRVPAQSVTSASQLPGSPSQISFSSPVTSSPYVKQLQTFMEHQRRTFDEERVLWNIERMELHEKITQLEKSLRGYQAISSRQIAILRLRIKAASGACWAKTVRTPQARLQQGMKSGVERNLMSSLHAHSPTL